MARPAASVLSLCLQTLLSLVWTGGCLNTRQSLLRASGGFWPCVPYNGGREGCGPFPTREETLLRVCCGGQSWHEEPEFIIAFLLAADLSERKNRTPLCPLYHSFGCNLSGNLLWDALGFWLLFTNKLLPSVSLNDKGEYTKNLHGFQVGKSIQFVENLLPHSLNT